MSRYIDADAFEKYFDREEWRTPDEKWWPEREIGMVLDLFSTADVVEAKHGEWFPIDVGDCCYRCSVCNFVRDAYLLEEDNYCPHCGARMDGEV